MPATRPKHLVHRWSRRLGAQEALDHMVEALQTLLQVTSSQDPLFLLRGLDLLVGHLGADAAFLATPEGEGFDVRWWSPEQEDQAAPQPVACFGRWLLENPLRMLVHRNLPEDPTWCDHPELQGRDLGAVAGAVLQEGRTVHGLLFVHFREPQAFDRPALALLDAVAGFISKVMEVEHLKFDLERAENALAITKAVVEDSSIQDSTTRLPNLRYLAIWLQANASAAQDVMTVALFQLPPASAADRSLLQAISEAVRGGDLLVSAGAGRFLLVLQHTAKGLGHLFLLRLRHKLGEWPMGATVWMPGQDDLHFESVRSRCDKALAASLAAPQPSLVWQLAEMEG